MANVCDLLVVEFVLCLKQPSSTRAESECSSTAGGKLTGTVADVVIDSCHSNELVPETAAESAYSQRDSEAAKDDCFTNDTQHLVEKQLDSEDTVIPSPEKDFAEGM